MPAPTIHHLASCESTMLEARALARSGAPAYTTVLADEQTAGRGRQGRAWRSEPGAGLYATVILPDGAGTPVAPLVVGVALAEAVQLETGVRAGLKWPNDLLAPDGRKLAGVLLERDARSGRVLAGVGVNLKDRDFGDLPAAALERFAPGPVDREALLRRFLERLQARLDEFGALGAAAALERWRDWNVTLGREVRVHLADGSAWDGVAVALEETGELRVRTPSGERTVSSGEVSLRFRSS